MQDKLNTILDNQIKIMAEIQYIKGYLNGIDYIPKPLDFNNKEQDKITEVEYKIQPKLMAFYTYSKRDDYVKNNPKATCEGIDTKTILDFIKNNIGKYLFLSGADLNGADLSDANLRGADLRYANLSVADLNGANLSGANLNGAKFNDKTKFPDGFIIPETMIKIN